MIDPRFTMPPTRPAEPPYTASAHAAAIASSERRLATMRRSDLRRAGDTARIATDYARETNDRSALRAAIAPPPFQQESQRPIPRGGPVGLDRGES